MNGTPRFRVLREDTQFIHMSQALGVPRIRECRKEDMCFLLSVFPHVFGSRAHPNSRQTSGAAWLGMANPAIQAALRKVCATAI